MVKLQPLGQQNASFVSQPNSAERVPPLQAVARLSKAPSRFIPPSRSLAL